METPYMKLYNKYTMLKNENETQLDKLNPDQEMKFMNYAAAADEMIQYLKSENDRLHGQVGELKGQLSSIRSSDEQRIHYQKLLEEENHKNKGLSEEIARLQKLECKDCSHCTTGHGPKKSHEDILRFSKMKMLLGGAAALFWAVVGCLAAISASILLLDEWTEYTLSMSTFVGFMVAAIFYDLGWIFRSTSIMGDIMGYIMGDKKKWMEKVVGNMIVSALTTVVAYYHGDHHSALFVIGYGCIALSVFAFMEVARPEFDFGILQFFMRLTLQTSVAYATHRSDDGWDASTAVLLIVGSVLCLIGGTWWQGYALDCFTQLNKPKPVPADGDEAREQHETSRQDGNLYSSY